MKLRDADTQKRTEERKEDQKNLTELIYKMFYNKIENALYPKISPQDYYKEKTEIANSLAASKLPTLSWHGTVIPYTMQGCPHERNSMAGLQL